MASASAVLRRAAGTRVATSMHAGTRDAGSTAAEVRPTDAARLDLGDIYDIVVARRRLLLPALGFCFAIALMFRSTLSQVGASLLKFPKRAG